MLKRLFKPGSRSFFNTLLLSFTVTSVISTLILTIFLTVNYINSITSYIKDTNKRLLSQTNYAIDELDKNVERLASSLLYNSNVTAYLNAPDIESTIPVLVSHEITKQCAAIPYVESVYLYNSSIDRVYSSKTGFQVALEDFENPDAAMLLGDPAFLAAYKKHPIPGSPNAAGAAETISYYFPVNYFGDMSDVLVINVYTSTLTDSISSMKGFSPEIESEFILLGQDNTYITSVIDMDKASATSWLPSALETIPAQIPSASFEKIDGSYYFQVCTRDNVYGWSLLNYASTDAVLHNVFSTTIASFLLFLCVLAVSFLLCIHISRRLNTPVETLVRALHEKRTPDNLSRAPMEFQKITDAVSSLQNSNRQLHSLQKKTRYSQTQYCLNSLISDYNPDSPASMHQQLEQLDLSYLEKEKLWMAVLKIDNYRAFLSDRNPDDLWAVRFSLVNIIEELASPHFTCNAFSRPDDKIVLLMALSREHEEEDLDANRTKLFRSIQESIDTYLHLTVSIAYSTAFNGLNNLSVVFKNMENSLLQKMRWGHGCIIDPYQNDEMPEEAFQLSSRSILQLTDCLNNGQAKDAWDVYQELAGPLFDYDYNEILSTCIHLIYSIYGRVNEKYPVLKDTVTQNVKDALAALEYAEISDDIHGIFRSYFDDICAAIQKLKTDPAQQNSAVTTEKVIKIIEREYTNSALCLCSIADEVGLSPNYVGHIFKQCTGKSVSQYILEIRMDKVGDYLKNTALPLQDILEKTGLEKNNYFYTRFKNYFGMSLSEYKQQV